MIQNTDKAMNQNRFIVINQDTLIKSWIKTKTDKAMIQNTDKAMNQNRFIVINQDRLTKFWIKTKIDKTMHQYKDCTVLIKVWTKTDL